MDERRRFLRLTWDQVAERGSITYETLRQVRLGTSAMRPLTKRAIEAGLDWPADLVDVILDGRLKDEHLAVHYKFSEQIDGRRAAVLAQDDALIDSIWASDLSDEDKLDLVRIVLEERADADRRARERFEERVRWRRQHGA